MGEGQPKDTPANEAARKKLETLFTQEEREALGLNEGGEAPVYLSELANPVLESNLNFLLKLANVVAEWEERFATLKEQSQGNKLADLKILLKEILDRSKGMDSPVALIENHGGEAEQSELQKLNARVTFLKQKIMEIIYPSPRSKR